MQYVSYFNGGDAVHYFARGAYGFQQSLGCVELPYTAAKAGLPVPHLRQPGDRDRLTVPGPPDPPAHARRPQGRRALSSCGNNAAGPAR